MPIDLTTKFLPYVDEIFYGESKKSLLTNQNFQWDGAHAVKVYKASTSKMNDYNRTGADNGNWSRYGQVAGLDATTETMTLRRDRSFTFAIDRLDQNETGDQLEAASALARQQREVIIPEVDSYVYGVMIDGAGNKPDAMELTKTNVYDEILKGSEALDNALASIERYNELCKAGSDDDFGKPASRMFALENPPYYACQWGTTAMLVCVGGLESDENCHTFTEEDPSSPKRDIIKGLYVCGNVQGSRYAVEYPICMRGISHSLCVYYGYIAGKNCVAGV